MAVLVSGSGTLLEAMIADSLPIELVIADRVCRGLEIASGSGIESLYVERTDFSENFDRDAYSATLAAELVERQIELVVMAGFGTVLSGDMFDLFGGRIINTHPALLPAFPGWHAVRDALAYGVEVTGCTVHVATPVVDDGPILAQEAVSVLADDDEASLHERIKVVERRLYIETIRSVVERGWITER